MLDAADAALAERPLRDRARPERPGRLQRGKASAARSDDAAFSALCERIALELEPTIGLIAESVRQGWLIELWRSRRPG